MEAIKEPDWNTVGVLGGARGARAADGGDIGTEHLLAGITMCKGPARGALEHEGATRTALLAVLRDRRDRDAAWSGTDDTGTSVATRDVLGEDGSDRFTGAAARALTTAMRQAHREGAEKFGAVHLLRALLAEDNHAVELLAACGITPEAVRAHLDGVAADSGDAAARDVNGGRADRTAREDDLPPLLHPTRDMLLGRAHYRHLPFWKRWLVKASGVNWASRPTWWAALETHEQARRLGSRTVGTEHLLLAILATHEVALRHPHLTREHAPTPDLRYAGGERLTRLGLDHAKVHQALTTARIPLSPDARPLKQYLDAATTPPTPTPTDEPWPDPGTGPLLETLLTEQTRARQLIEALTSPTTP
ncbi:Clp protease N-terminal domain-containing protein [Streptomyces brasiliscabiei]|uniref:Clp protease N-terminal domain-containing protein n=1 Tax=Streptomyces brasiliscabiei TaxID=2736302 RepID=A0ABU8GJE4_9ACTN